MSRAASSGTGFDWLVQIAYLAGRSLDMDVILPPALAALADLIPAEHVVVLQLENDIVEVRGSWSRPESEAAIGGGCAFRRPDSLSVFEPQVVRVAPGAEVPELPYLSRGEQRGHGLVALMVPLTIDYICVGRIDFIRDGDGEPFSSWERQSAEACARVVALALRNCTEYARVVWLAEHDPLTGIGNRRAFDIALNRELARAERYRRDVSLLLIDLDDFKEANTHLGLSGGDEILRRTARVLAERARKGVDIPCRIGGDEFAMILPEISEHLARDLAERLVKDVGNATLSLWPMRFSYSISTYPSTSAEFLRRAADARLMAAKSHKGRIAMPVRGAAQ
ncbi:MAG: GGDEF domain-containing protein [Acidiferrobacter sp.]